MPNIMNTPLQETNNPFPEVQGYSLDVDWAYIAATAPPANEPTRHDPAPGLFTPLARLFAPLTAEVNAAFAPLAAGVDELRAWSAMARDYWPEAASAVSVFCYQVRSSFDLTYRRDLVSLVQMFRKDARRAFGTISMGLEMAGAAGDPLMGSAGYAVVFAGLCQLFIVSVWDGSQFIICFNMFVFDFLEGIYLFSKCLLKLALIVLDVVPPLLFAVVILAFKLIVGFIRLLRNTPIIVRGIVRNVGMPWRQSTIVYAE
ncbi:hypothetical protein Q8F55_007591 [Vanrija albida]|uniref:Uncharacterized protein n=1 Tax=Vanrija albida TaxID=181172 RepID=A0ABR3PTY6_9TREE